MAEISAPLSLAPGIELFSGYLDRPAQEALLSALDAVIAAAPFRRPITPWGKPMSVGMTSCGAFGWITDRKGYRYEKRQPDGAAWPAIPEEVGAIWDAVAQCPRPPECCLVNHYGDKARMGLHQDRDEADFSCPVVSVSLGDRARFRFGGQARSDPTRSVELNSGDVLVMRDAGRLAFHGVDRIYPGSSTLLPGGGRINLTLRVVT